MYDGHERVTAQFTIHTASGCVRMCARCVYIWPIHCVSLCLRCSAEYNDRPHGQNPAHNNQTKNRTQPRYTCTCSTEPLKLTRALVSFQLTNIFNRIQFLVFLLSLFNFSLQITHNKSATNDFVECQLYATIARPFDSTFWRFGSNRNSEFSYASAQWAPSTLLCVRNHMFCLPHANWIKWSVCEMCV